MVRQRVRIRFRKQGDLRWIGHRDLMRCMERLFRRAELPLAVSQGFHPKPRMTFPSPLAVGIEGRDEVMEVELAAPRTAEELRLRLLSHLPAGLSLDAIEVLPQGSKKARVRSLTYELPIPPQLREEVAGKVRRLLAAPAWPVRRPGRAAPVDLHSLLEELALRDGLLRIRLRVGQAGGAGPRDVLGALDLGEIELQGARLVRTAVEIH